MIFLKFAARWGFDDLEIGQFGNLRIWRFEGLEMMDITWKKLNKDMSYKSATPMKPSKEI